MHINPYRRGMDFRRWQRERIIHRRVARATRMAALWEVPVGKNATHDRYFSCLIKHCPICHAHREVPDVKDLRQSDKLNYDLESFWLEYEEADTQDEFWYGLPIQENPPISIPESLKSKEFRVKLLDVINQNLDSL